MATQQEIANHLGLSLKGARNMLAKLGIDNKLVSLDYVRLAYIESLDVVGEERKGQMSITSERIKLMEAQRLKIKLETKKIRGAVKTKQSQASGLGLSSETEKRAASECLADAAEQTDKLAALLSSTFENHPCVNDDDYEYF